MFARPTPLLLGLGLLVPVAASAEQPPEALVAAMDIDPSMIVAGSVSTVSTQEPTEVSSPTMFDVRTALGVISPYNAPTAALLSTGNVNNIELLQDHDYPGNGFDTSSGDRATLHFQLEVPEYANSYSFNFYFLSREYPEWVGNIYNDQFEVFVNNSAYTGQIVFDAFGNEVSVNNALFSVTNPSMLVGTGFDQDGGTGWVTTIAPVDGGTTLDVAFEVYDLSDGVWDSAVLIDNFQFSSQEPPTDGPWTGDDTPDVPIEIGFLSPKEGDLGGDYGVTIHGAGFDETTSVQIGATGVSATVANSGEALVIDPDDFPSADTPGTVDVVVSKGDQTIILENGFTYHDGAAGSVPPRVLNVLPSEAHPSGGTEIDVRGEGIVDGASIVFLDAEGNEVPEADSVVFNDLGDGNAQLIFNAPSLDEGWHELLVENPDGLRTNPGYPFLVTDGAAAPDNNGGGTVRRGCSTAGSASGLAGLFVLGLALMRRREV